MEGLALAGGETYTLLSYRYEERTGENTTDQCSLPGPSLGINGLEA